MCSSPVADVFFRHHMTSSPHEKPTNRESSDAVGRETNSTMELGIVAVV